MRGTRYTCTLQYMTKLTSIIKTKCGKKRTIGVKYQDIFRMRMLHYTQLIISNNTFVFEIFPAPVEPPSLGLFSHFVLLAEDQVEMVFQVAVLWWMS